MKTETSKEKGERVMSPKKHRIKNKHKNNTSKVASADSKTPPGTKATPSLTIRKETAKRRKNKYIEKPKSQEAETQGPALSRLAKADPVRPLNLRSPSPRTQSIASENVKLGDRGPLTTLQILQTPNLSPLYVNESIEDNNLQSNDGSSKKRKTDDTSV